MYLVLKMGIFQLVMLVFRGGYMHQMDSLRFEKSSNSSIWVLLPKHPTPPQTHETYSWLEKSETSNQNLLKKKHFFEGGFPTLKKTHIPKRLLGYIFFSMNTGINSRSPAGGHHDAMELQSTFWRLGADILVEDG